MLNMSIMNKKASHKQPILINTRL